MLEQDTCDVSGRSGWAAARQIRARTATFAVIGDLQAAIVATPRRDDVNDESMADGGPGDVGRSSAGYRGVDGSGDPTRRISPEDAARGPSWNSLENRQVR